MIRILSTDFDGTLVEHDAVPAVDDAFFESVYRIRRQGGVWAVNTGRTVAWTDDGLRTYGFPFEPDYILTCEREVFRPRQGGGWEDFGDWNARCAAVHRALAERARAFIGELAEWMRAETGAEMIFEQGEPIGLVARDEAEMDRVVAWLTGRSGGVEGFGFQRNTQYLRFSHRDYHKGSALGELGRLLGVPRERILAVGDHHNDIPMLDGRFAAMAACPANAIDAVKEVVRGAGGHVARESYSRGVIEAIARWGGGNGSAAG